MLWDFAAKQSVPFTAYLGRGQVLQAVQLIIQIAHDPFFLDLASGFLVIR